MNKDLADMGGELGFHAHKVRAPNIAPQSHLNSQAIGKYHHLQWWKVTDCNVETH